MLSIVVPVYNEKDIVVETIENLQSISTTSEIIVVNDGSTDGTPEELERVKGIKVVTNYKNLGYGAALKNGIDVAIGEDICIIDADGTYPISKIDEIYSIYLDNKNDMIVGSRTGKHVKIPLVRKPAKKLLSILANYVSSRDIPDINSGMRIFKKEVYKEFINTIPDGFSFTTTITLAMLMNKYNVEYVPIDYYHRSGKSKIKPFQDTRNFIILIMRIGLYFSPSKIFLPMAMALAAAGLLVAVITKVYSGEIADIAVLIIILSSFQLFSISVLAELINHRIPKKLKTRGNSRR